MLIFCHFDVTVVLATDEILFDALKVIPLWLLLSFILFRNTHGYFLRLKFAFFSLFKKQQEAFLRSKTRREAQPCGLQNVKKQYEFKYLREATVK